MSSNQRQHSEKRVRCDAFLSRVTAQDDAISGALANRIRGPGSSIGAWYGVLGSVKCAHCEYRLFLSSGFLSRPVLHDPSAPCSRQSRLFTADLRLQSAGYSLLAPSKSTFTQSFLEGRFTVVVIGAGQNQLLFLIISPSAACPDLRVSLCENGLL